MKLKKLFIITIGMILSIQSLVFCNNISSNRNVILKEMTIDKNEGSSIAKIYIDWYRGDAKILKSDNDEIKIIQKAVTKVDSLYNFTSKIENGKLTIECINNPFKGTSINNYKNNTYVTILYSNGSSKTVPRAEYDAIMEETFFDLELYLPQKQYDSIHFNSDNGASITANDLNITDFNVEISNGNTSINNMTISNVKTDTTNGSFISYNSKIENLNIDSVNGMVDIKTTSVNKDFNIDIVNGEINIRYDEVPKNLKACIVNGKNSLYIPDNAGFIANVEKSKYSSKLNTDFDLKESKGIYTYKNGGNNIDLSCVNGDINIYKNK